jgi:hypothetical protein
MVSAREASSFSRMFFDPVTARANKLPPSPVQGHVPQEAPQAAEPLDRLIPRRPRPGRGLVWFFAGMFATLAVHVAILPDLHVGRQEGLFPHVDGPLAALDPSAQRLEARFLEDLPELSKPCDRAFLVLVDRFAVPVHDTRCGAASPARFGDVPIELKGHFDDRGFAAEWVGAYPRSAE